MNKRFFYTGSFVLLLAFAVLSAVYLTNVEAGDERVATQKAYISYEIKAGDTLFSIAEENTANSGISIDDYIDEVKVNNQLSSDKIIVGKKLIIATYSYE